MAINALNGMPVNPPNFDLVGPTVDDDIRRAINRYGANAVRVAIKKLAKPARGRPKINDWRELRHVGEADAREWLKGGDPIAARTNYSIAKQFAETNPGQSAISTHQRIERKLREKPQDRLWFMLVSAESLSRENYSWKQHIRALEALCKSDSHPVWTDILHRANSEVTDYIAKKGKPPANSLTMKEVEECARNAGIPLSRFASGDFSGLSPSYASRKTIQD